MKKFCQMSWKQLLNRRFKISLTKICIKNEIWKFFSRIRKLDLDMIWDHDRYVKASPGSTLQSSNNGLTIFYDLGRKAGNFSASKEICCKKRFWHFFENYRKSMSRSKISSWNHSESKEHTRNIFPSYSYEGRISKSEKSFMHILLAFLKLIFKLNSLINIHVISSL